MKEERAINIDEFRSILKAHYGYKSVSIKRIWSGMGPCDMTGIDLGPGGTLDMLLEVDNGKEDRDDLPGGSLNFVHEMCKESELGRKDDKNKEVFSSNVVERIGERMAKQTERIDALEWHIKNVEKHLVEIKKEVWNL